MKVGVSFLSTNDTIENEVKKLDETNADYIHVDFMDGIFVKNTFLSVLEIKEIDKMVKNKKLDVHMMVCSPNKYVKDFAKMKNVEYLTLHYESHRRPIDVINMLRHTNLKIGIAINPETKVSHIIPLLHLVDQVLVMSVKAGEGGQKFMEDILYKIESLKELRKENNYHYIIAVDGGVDSEAAKMCKKAGADLVDSGTYVIKSNDYNKAIDSLR